MSNTLRNGIVLLGLVAMPFMANRASAQGPTPGPTAEGTIIANTASASFTDANSNTYTAVTATANVKVGFSAGIDVVSQGTVTPASPSSGQFADFKVYNTGNGTDTLVIGTPTASTGLTITGYKYGATTYATLAALNAQLATDAATTTNSYNSFVLIEVKFDVAAGHGGENLSISLPATSQRNNTKTDSDTDPIHPVLSAGVAVTPSNGALNNLIGDASKTTTFTVTNNGTGSDTYSLGLATDASSNVTSISISACSPVCSGSNSAVTLAASASATITVTYSISSSAAAGTNSGNNDLKLTATSQFDGTKTSTGKYTITVTKAALSIAKAAYTNVAGAPGVAIGDPVTTPSTTDRVLPGDTVWYKITVGNPTSATAAAATSVSVSDVLPNEVLYVSNSADTPTGGQSAWSVSYNSATNKVTATLAAMAIGETGRYYWIRVVVR